MTLALGVYRHSKGNLYEVTAIAKDATNGGNAGLPCVVYRSKKTGDVFLRDLDQFVELVTWPDGAVRPRFNLVEKAGPADDLTFVSRASELVSLLALAKVTKERDTARRAAGATTTGDGRFHARWLRAATSSELLSPRLVSELRVAADLLDGGEGAVTK